MYIDKITITNYNYKITRRKYFIMDNKLTNDQLDEVHGGMLLVDENKNVYLVDENNYGILFQCTFKELSQADIPSLYTQYGLANISELTNIDHALNNPDILNLRSKKGSNLQYNGHLQSGRYLRVVQGTNGLPQVLNGIINIP